MIPHHIHILWNDVPTARDQGPTQGREIQGQNLPLACTQWSIDSAATFLSEYIGPHARDCFDACELPLLKAELFAAAVLALKGGVVVSPTDIPLEPAFSSIDYSRDFLARGSPFDPHESHKGSAYWASSQRNRVVGDALSRMLTAVARDARTVREVSNHFRTIAADMIAQADARTDQEPQHPESTFDFVPDAPDLDARLSSFQGRANVGVSRWVPVIFLGHPRGGSMALAKALRSAGLKMGYEGYGPDGVVSWWHTGSRLPKVRQHVFSSGAGEGNKREMWVAGKAFHYIRDPRQAIPSIVLENEAKSRRNNSFTYRRKKLKQRFGIDLEDLDPGAAAATSYALWNKMAEDVSTDGRVFVERPDLSAAFPGLKLHSIPRTNTSLQLFGQEKPSLDVARAIASCPFEARQLLERYLDLYTDSPA